MNILTELFTALYNVIEFLALQNITRIADFSPIPFLSFLDLLFLINFYL